MKCRSRSTTLLACAITFTCQTASAETIELPSRKSGHWQIRMTTEMPAGLPEMQIELCIDEATDKTMMKQGLALTNEICSKQEIKRLDNTITIDAVCNVGAIKSTSRTVITGDFQSSYMMKITSELDGFQLGRNKTGKTSQQQTSMTQHASWISATCPADLKPGDMKMPGGVKVNIKDMLQ